MPILTQYFFKYLIEFLLGIHLNLFYLPIDAFSFSINTLSVDHYRPRYAALIVLLYFIRRNGI